MSTEYLSNWKDSSSGSNQQPTIQSGGRMVPELRSIVLVLILFAGLMLSGCSDVSEVSTPNSALGENETDLTTEALEVEQTARDVVALLTKANQLESEFKFAEAVAVWESIFESVASQTGADSWQATNARLSLNTAKTQARFDAGQLELLRQFIAKQESATNNLDSGQLQNVVTDIEWMIGAAETLLGRDSHSIGRLKLRLGQTLYTSGNFAASKQYFKSALAINQKQLGEVHPETETNLFLLGQNSMQLGEFETGCQLLAQTEKVSIELWGSEHATTAARKNDLGVAYHTAGQLDQAEKKLGEALSMRIKLLEPKSKEIGETFRNLGVVYIDQKNFELAKESLMEAVEVLSNTAGESNLMTLDSRANLATVNMLNKDYLAAEGQLRQVVHQYESTAGNSVGLAKSCYQLAVALGYQGQYHEAEPLLNRALNIQRNNLGQWHPSTIKTMETLATLYERTDQDDRANSINDALEGFRKRQNQ